MRFSRDMSKLALVQTLVAWRHDLAQYCPALHGAGGRVLYFSNMFKDWDVCLGMEVNEVSLLGYVERDATSLAKVHAGARETP